MSKCRPWGLPLAILNVARYASPVPTRQLKLLQVENPLSARLGDEFFRSLPRSLSSSQVIPSPGSEVGEWRKDQRAGAWFSVLTLQCKLGLDRALLPPFRLFP